LAAVLGAWRLSEIRVFYLFKGSNMARENSQNLDPISQEPGAHPVGTGVGGVVVGAGAGAAAGAFGGPVGALVGGVVGAVAGGLGGKAVAEAINPTDEEAYWRDNYHREPYYEAGRTFDDYGPAYRLGLQARGDYIGTFDQTESRLATHWDVRKERSTLSWDEARVASRAAWDRIDRQLESGTLAGSVAGDSDPDMARDTAATVNNEYMDNDAMDNEDMDKDDVVDTLNDLLESCRDGEYGFRECGAHTVAQDIKTLMLRHADECRDAGVELLGLIRKLGGKPDDGGSMSGAMHRGWVSLRGTLTGYSDEGMLDECERGEDAALARYRKALKEELPASIRAVVERQAQGAQRNHDQVKALRDAVRAAR
jgi:uncharacterized protein (TIGR02284 family)